MNRISVSLRKRHRKPRNYLIIGGGTDARPKLFHKRQKKMLNNRKILTIIIRSYTINFVFLQLISRVSCVEMQKTTSETNLIFALR